MKKNILITDTVKELSVEKSVLKDYNLKLSKISKLSERELSNVNAIITGHHENFNSKILKKLKNCKVISKYGAGYDNVDLKYAKKKGIKVFNVPDYGPGEVADFALAMSMSFLKNLNQYYFKILEKDKKNYWNYSNGLIHRRLSTLKIGVVGLGRIGSNYAKKILSLGCNVFFYDPYVKNINKSLKKVSSLKKIFDICDLVTLHVPLTKKTKFFINDALFINRRKGIILINAARGELIKEDTIIKNLKNNKIMYYGADVLENEPINFNNKLFKLIKSKKFQSRVIITPHAAFFTKESFYDLRFKASKNILDFFKGTINSNCVN